MEALNINIIGLSLKAHYFEFNIDEEFWEAYKSDFIHGGKFKINVILDKNETFIEANFKIKGSTLLVCDRSLEEFEFPIEIERKILFKYGETEEELSDEIIIISRDRINLDLGQLVFEFIGLSIPIKKLHPKFQEDENEEEWEGKVVYSSSSSNGDKVSNSVWEKLKKLK